MKATLQSLRELVLNSEERLESMKEEIERCEKRDTYASHMRAGDLQMESAKEYEILADFRQSLYYLRRAAGHKDIDVFNPEKF